jgi:ribosomal protein S18 acetylase RimI-like enzyme
MKIKNASSSIEYRGLKIEDLDAVVAVHQKAFKNFFLTSLGSKFIYTYYKKCIEDRKVVAVVAVESNQTVIGFAMGNVESKNFHKELLIKNFVSFFNQGILLIFKNPKAVFRLIRNLKKEKKKINDEGNYAELLSIGIDPHVKGSGIGKGLLRYFEFKIIEKKCKKIALTTDFYNNEYALMFYQKVGYSIYYDFTAYPNRRMYKLIKTL